MTHQPTRTSDRTLDDLPLLLTVEEAAGILRIGRNGAYAAVSDGVLPSIRIGRRIRIPRAALAALLQQHSAVASVGAGSQND